MSHSRRTSGSASLPKEIAPGVYYLEAGNGITRSKVYFVRSGSSWALIDTASAHCGRVIQEAAASLFGADTPPAAILLTHDHPDHAGSARELAQRWGCLAYVHRDELPLVTMDLSSYLPTVKQFANPLDTWVILPLLHVMPRRARASMLLASSFEEVARALDPGTTVPGLPDWEYLATPGHTPGHVSFFRPRDRVLITGDAVVTVHLNSLWSFLLWSMGRNTQRLSGPPRYTPWSGRAAKESIASLARLEPCVLACGHGRPLSGSRAASELRALARARCAAMATALGVPSCPVVKGVHSLTAAALLALAILATLTGACGSVIFFQICKICPVLLTVSMLISRAVRARSGKDIRHIQHPWEA